MAIVGYLAIGWLGSEFVSFNYLNSKKQHLLLLWMKISNQIPNYEIKGLSKKANAEFWAKENVYYNYFVKFYIAFTVFACVIINIQLFYIRFNTSINSFIFWTLLHIISNSYYLFQIFGLFYLMNFFFLTQMLFFKKKFNYISTKVEKMTNQKSCSRTSSIAGFSTVDNRKLAKLIYDYNYVYLEMVKINEYFKWLSGFNYVYYFMLVINMSFSVAITQDFKVQLCVFLALIFMYILIIYVSFTWSNNVTVAFEKANFHFQNASFSPNVSLSNRKKMNLIIFIVKNEHSGFTCFDVFRLTSYQGYLVSIACVIKKKIKFY